jgi:branched-subunit amino acid aminotransferase/4-amino-4-deoxychorismate lyase
VGCAGMAAAAAAAAASVWLVRDGVLHALAPGTSGVAVVKELGAHSVYTSLRSLRGRPVSLSVHVERLQRSALESGLAAPSREAVARLVAQAVGAVGSGQDAVVTVATDGVRLVAHSKAVTAPPAPPVRVALVHAHRAFGEVKDAAWITQREALPWPPGINEQVMEEEDGTVLEGFSSNFFVVRENGVIETAAGGAVLSGSIRRLALRIAAAQGVGVALRAPQWQERDQWKDAFITSTSRLILPVDEISDAVGNSWVFHDSDPPQGRVQGLQHGRYPDRYTSRHPSLMKLLRGLEAELEAEASTS